MRKSVCDCNALLGLRAAASLQRYMFPAYNVIGQVFSCPYYIYKDLLVDNFLLDSVLTQFQLPFPCRAQCVFQ